MGISHYIKEIGRGKDGARALTRAQAADLFGQVLDAQVTDLEVGAFCLAMRIKGETPQELAGFLDAAQARLTPLASDGTAPVVLPSYNGARKLPVLTPLLALLLAQRGLPVLLHGAATESQRVHAFEVFQALNIAPHTPAAPLRSGHVHWLPTAALAPGLHRLLEVRRVVGLRNPAHSVVKLLNPCAGRAVVVGSYTHPEYATAMAATFELLQADAVLLRGTEGEPVADARRLPQLAGFVAGHSLPAPARQDGPLVQVPDLPSADATATAAYTQAALQGQRPVPAPITAQVDYIVHVHQQVQQHVQQQLKTP